MKSLRQNILHKSIITLLFISLLSIEAKAQVRGGDIKLDQSPIIRLDTNIDSRNFLQRLVTEPLVSVRDDKTDIVITPLLDQIVGRNSKFNGDYWWRNGRGAYVGVFGNNLEIEAYILEMQTVHPPSFLSEFYESHGAIPEYSRWKRFKENGFDANNAGGTIALNPTEGWHLKGGYGKVIQGAGYRNLVFGRNFASYPFLQSSINLYQNKLRLENVWFRLSSSERIKKTASAEAQFQQNRGVKSSIIYDVSKKLSVGLGELRYSRSHKDEGLLMDSKENPATWYDYNPIPLLGVLARHIKDDKPDERVESNSVTLDILFKPNNYLKFYGTAFVDFFTENGQFQLGGEFNLQREFGLRFRAEKLWFSDVALLSEYSGIFPANGDMGDQQTLLESEASYKRFFLHGTGVIYSVYKAPSGTRNTRLVGDFGLGYVINPSYHLKIQCGYAVSGLDRNIYVRLATHLFGRRLDF
ncbi:hypothetical protein [Luteibaculum oceani]|uniref:Uncharacterized protein n=1 Tax=Luteibaculum oceani TaxID=1294296 RepID=A0A5C6VJH4_9FLAO|nr:hypothetical protein [Luteibaculum oceani]TXC85050.1 hypothetical protein FRX97_00055 [Luteibaculum oceani]